jgi:ribonuclease VapC
MVIDGSAMMAMVLDDHEAARLLDALVGDPVRRMSAATWLEVAIVIEERGGRIAALRLDEFIRAAGIEIVPVSAEQATVARTAWRHFGMTRHSIRLNYGDCLAYALAKTTGDRLLFSGAGFSRTDVEPAVAQSAA